MKTDISSALQALVVEGNLIKLPSHYGQLPDAEFKELKKSLSNIGGSWKTNKQGWLFKTDPTPFLEKLRSRTVVNIYQDNQFFYTTKEVFNHMIDWDYEYSWKLELPTRISSANGIKFLEPEAGEGHIIEYFKEKYGETKGLEIFCCEPFERNIEILKSKGHKPFVKDFLSLDKKYNNFFDLIIANPPFSDNQYIDHIYKMYDVTKEGGTILTIAPDNYNDTNNKKRLEFKEWLHSVHAIEKDVPVKLFRGNKANVKTRVIWIDVLYS